LNAREWARVALYPFSPCARVGFTGPLRRAGLPVMIAGETGGRPENEREQCLMRSFGMVNRDDGFWIY
jgi:hypothetical protein